VIYVVRIGLLGLGLISILAMSDPRPSSAFAGKHNPEFRWCQEMTGGKYDEKQCKKTGGAGGWEEFGKFNNEQEQIEAEANGEQILKETALKLTTVCGKVKINPESAHIFGGEAETEKLGGKTEAKAIEYRECTVEKPENCEIRSKGAASFGEVNTKEVALNLVFENSEAAKNEKQFENGRSVGLVLLKPKKGKILAELEYKTGPKEKPTCTIPAEEAMEGEVLTRIVDNPEARSTEHIIEALPKAKIYWINEGGKQIKKETQSLKVGGFGAEIEGTIKLKLKGKGEWWEWN
jgi:hypothetical protein